MPSRRVQSILAEKARREAFPRAVEAYLDTLFPLQRALVDSPAPRKCTHTGRRGGKTRAFVGRAFKAVRDFPGATIPVFERTLTCVAAQTFWTDLITFNDTYKLGVDFHHTYKSATFRNGAVIQLMGADTLESCDKARGGKFPVAIVDEAGTFRSKVLEYLVTECLEPATIDLQGEILVGGTPNPQMSGWFYETATYGKERGWDVHHWTLVDNPALGPESITDPAARRAWRVQWLADLRLRYGWTEQTPRYVREYEGRWAVTGDDFIYPFSRAINVVEALPEGRPDDWTYALSIDIGFNDPTAFVVWGRRDGDPTSYVIESYEQTHLIPSAVAAHVERLRDRYTFRSIVCDTGGMGKAVAEEMRQRFGLPIRAAAKRDKLVYLEFVAGELRAGRIRILRGRNMELIDDLCNLAWNDERTDSSPGARDHLPDAFLYGEREISSWSSAIGLGERDGPTPYSDEWWLAEELRMEEAAEARWKESKSNDWKASYGWISD